MAALAVSCGPTDPIPDGPSVVLTEVGTIPAGAGDPTALVGVPDGSGRSFLVGQDGFVYVMTQAGIETDPILDLPDRGISIALGFEQGLLDLAFHPQFAAAPGTPGRGLFYTYQAEFRDGAADFSHPELAASPPTFQTTLREWQVSPTDPGVVLPGSRVVLRIDQPQSNHNGGGLAFSPDGLLYIGIGDGGGSDDNDGGINAPNDGHTNGTGNGNDRTNIYGSIVRIDPLGSDSANGQYGLPGNGVPAGLPELFAFGFRNPYRVSVDGLGRIWAGDVGEGDREEVSLVVGGLDHGWPYREGTRVNRAGGPPFSVGPVGEYTHSEGFAVIGGFVYAGDAVAALQDRYVFADWASLPLVMETDTGAISEILVVGGKPAEFITGIGKDPDGELYYLLSGTGRIVRIDPDPNSDIDGDGDPDVNDNCPHVSNADQANSDGDAIGDACDVCTAVTDPAQRDRDGDGFGDLCDCDFNGDGFCNLDDFSLFMPDFSSGQETTLGTDMTGDGFVNVDDASAFLPGFQVGVPGPSAP